MSALVHTLRDERDAAMASVLAAAVRAEQLQPADALRVIRHEMRRRNTNKTATIWPRSQAAHDVVTGYAARGELPPKNGSPDALHADHVHPLTATDLMDCNGVESWLSRLAELREVVCVTAAENYRLQVLEKAGVTGWAKYEEAGITWASAEGDTSPSPTDRSVARPSQERL